MIREAVRYTERMEPNEIRAWRASRRLTLRELAERLGGVALTTVSAWESGRQKPAPYLSLALRELDRELAEESVPVAGG